MAEAKPTQNPLMTLLLRAVLPCQQQGRLRRRGHLSIRLQVYQRFKALILMGNHKRTTPSRWLTALAPPRWMSGERRRANSAWR